MLRYFEQIEHTQKSRLACQLWSDIRETDIFDGVHLDLAFLHTVSGAHRHARTDPEPDAAGNLSATNSLAKPFGEHHAESLNRRRRPEVKSVLLGFDTARGRNWKLSYVSLDKP